MGNMFLAYYHIFVTFYSHLFEIKYYFVGYTTLILLWWVEMYMIGQFFLHGLPGLHVIIKISGTLY